MRVWLVIGAFAALPSLWGWSSSSVLRGNVHPLPASAVDQGQAEGSLRLPRIAIHFRMTPAQQADLDALLRAQQDRSSPQYHQWLTPEQYADRFGMSRKDLARIVGWLESRGFIDIQPARSRTFVTMSGNAALVEYAFDTPIHRYQVDGRAHYANRGDPVLPQELRGRVTDIRGLNDFRLRPRTRPRPRLTSELTGSHFLAPGDFATIYGVQALYNSGIDGTGQKIAIPGQTDIQISDIQAFQTAAGLPLRNPQILLAGPDPGTSADDESEAALDIEWAGAVARGATIVYVNSPDVFTSVTYAVDHNVAPVLSITYGACETQLSRNTVNSVNSILAQANAQGMTVLAASGDSGAADCESTLAPGGMSPAVATHGLAVDFPASSPYVTAMGGTTFNEGTATYWSATNGANGGSALSYIPETAWNDTSATAGLSATGGGASELFPKPSWQQGPGVPADAARHVPDVSLAASPSHDGYLICSGGWCTNGFRNASTYFDVIGGTSAGAPTFAGIVALINQQTASTQGNINPILYSLAQVSTDAFHDIVTGNNQVPCQAGTPDCAGPTLGYTAGAGYDQVTGLGTVNAYNLVTEWTSDFQISISPGTLTLAPGASGTATAAITRFSHFSGTVSFACTVSGTLSGVTCSIPGTVAGSGSATLTVTRAAAAGLVRLPSPGLPLAGWGAAWLVAAASGLLLFRRRRVARMACGGAAVLGLALLAGCGGGSKSSTPTPPAAPTATVVVTATCGTLNHSVSVSVTGS
jgi:subtilase family serine protease